MSNRTRGEKRRHKGLDIREKKRERGVRRGKVAERKKV